MEIDKEQFETLLASLPENQAPDPDPILLQENSLEIDRVHRTVNKSLEAILELHQLCGIDSFDKLFTAQNDVKGFIHGEMKKNKTLKTLSESIDISMLTVPAGLQRAEVLLANTFSKDFLIFIDGEWSIEFNILESHLEAWRYYAKTPEQIEKYHLTKGLCDYLNAINMGTYSKHGFMSRMVQLDLTNGFVPDPNWILSSNATDYKN